MSTKIADTKKTPTKLDTILKHLRHKRSASLVVLEKITGWQPHSVRAALTGLRKKGHIIERSKNAKGVTVYGLAGNAGE